MVLRTIDLQRETGATKEAIELTSNDFKQLNVNTPLYIAFEPGDESQWGKTPPSPIGIRKRSAELARPKPSETKNTLDLRSNEIMILY